MDVRHRAARLAHGVVVAVRPGELVEAPAMTQVGAAGDARLDQRVNRPVHRGRVHRGVARPRVRQDRVGADVVATAQCLKDQQALGGGTTTGPSQEGGGGIHRLPLGSYLQLNRVCGRAATCGGHRAGS